MENFHDIDFKKVGARIRNARKTLSLTQEKATEQAFISSQYWSLLESRRERASVNTYWQIAAVLAWLVQIAIALIRLPFPIAGNSGIRFSTLENHVEVHAMYNLLLQCRGSHKIYHISHISVDTSFCVRTQIYLSLLQIALSSHRLDIPVVF